MLRSIYSLLLWTSSEIPPTRVSALMDMRPISSSTKSPSFEMWAQNERCPYRALQQKTNGQIHRDFSTRNSLQANEKDQLESLMRNIIIQTPLSALLFRARCQRCILQLTFKRFNLKSILNLLQFKRLKSRFHYSRGWYWSISQSISGTWHKSLIPDESEGITMSLLASAIEINCQKAK